MVRALLIVALMSVAWRRWVHPPLHAWLVGGGDGPLRTRPVPPRAPLYCEGRIHTSEIADRWE